MNNKCNVLCHRCRNPQIYGFQKILPLCTLSPRHFHMVSCPKFKVKFYLLNLIANNLNGLRFRPRVCTWKDILSRGQPGLIRWFFLWYMPLVQVRSLDRLTSSPARYHCTTDAPRSLIRELENCQDVTKHNPYKLSFGDRYKWWKRQMLTKGQITLKIVWICHQDG